jgi:hypothetical protein
MELDPRRRVIDTNQGKWNVRGRPVGESGGLRPGCSRDARPQNARRPHLPRKLLDPLDPPEASRDRPRHGHHHRRGRTNPSGTDIDAAHVPLKLGGVPLRNLVVRNEVELPTKTQWR